MFSRAEAEASITHIAERANVPQPITRRELWDRTADFYPDSIVVSFAGSPLPPTAVAASDLSDAGSGWAYPAVDRVLIDPVLGRLALPPSLTVDGQPVAMADPVVSFHYGAAADIGGGAYARVATFADDLGTPVPVAAPGSIATALAGLGGSGIVEVTGNGRFKETLAIAAGAGERIELRAADGSRPTVELGAELVIDLDEGAEVTLNGLVLAGAGVRVPAAAKGGRLRLVHCTLVPGISLLPDGAPAQPDAPSLVIASATVSVEIDHSIVGGIRADEDAQVRIRDSIVDACDQTAVAYAAPAGDGRGRRAGGHRQHHRRQGPRADPAPRLEFDPRRAAGRDGHLDQPRRRRAPPGWLHPVQLRAARLAHAAPPSLPARERRRRQPGPAAIQRRALRPAGVWPAEPALSGGDPHRRRRRVRDGRVAPRVRAPA